MKKRKASYPFESIDKKTKAKAKAKRFVQGEKSAYEIAFLDDEFLLKTELRSVRLELEFLKAEMTQLEQGINSTIVIFGSSRILPPDVAEKMFKQEQAEVKKDPNNVTKVRALEFARKQLIKSHYYQEARHLGYLISSKYQGNKERDFVVLTGGGPGIMEAANRGAYDAKAKSMGLNIFLPMEQDTNPYISPELNLRFHYFAMRKMHFLIRAKAMIFFPGGFGTLDELFEVLTLLQTKKIKNVPVLLFGKEYWGRVINFAALVEEQAIDAEDVEYFQFVETAEQAWESIAKFYKLKK